MKTHKKTLTILIEWGHRPEDQDTRDIQAFHCMGTSFYVHRSIEDNMDWAISHKTGLSLKQGIRTKQEAMDIVEAINDKAFWNFDSKCAARFFKDEGEFDYVKRIMEKLI